MILTQLFVAKSYSCSLFSVIGRVYSPRRKTKRVGCLKRSHDSVFSENNLGNNISNKTKEKLQCSHCNRNNPTINKCFNSHAFPDRHKFQKKNEKDGSKIEL